VHTYRHTPYADGGRGEIVTRRPGLQIALTDTKSQSRNSITTLAAAAAPLAMKSFHMVESP